MADGTVYIDTRMDTSGFDSGSENMEKSMDETSVKIQKILSNTEKSAKSKAASIAAIYRKQGLTQQEAFKKAWEEIERDTKQGTKKVNKHIKGIGTQSQKTSKDMVSSFSGAISKLGVVIGSVFAVSKLIQFGKEAIDLGSDLQEVQNVVDVTFSTMNEQVNEFARNAAETAGLSETMAKRYTGTFGAMAKAFGFAEGEAFSMSTSLTQLAGDVASFYNLTQDEAYTKLKSVFTGETETLKDLGVVMTQNALDSYAMAKGYGKTTSKMSEQEKVALRYSFVLDQLSSAQGDFARTSDSWANQTRILSLNFDSFKANIGQALINIFTPFLKLINQIVSKMAQLSSYFVAFSEMLVGKSTSGGGGSPGEALAEISSGYDAITDSTNEAAKAQKKYLSGLDEIRTFQDDDVADTGISSDFGFGNISSETEKVADATATIEDLEKRFPKLTAFLNDSVQLIKDIFNDFKVGDFFKAGHDISELVSGIFDFFSEAIDDVDWEVIGKKIGDFIAGINWKKVIESAFKLKFNIWKAIAEIWFGAFDAAPIETAILTAIAALTFTGAGDTLLSGLKSAILSETGLSFVAGAFAIGATIFVAFELAEDAKEWWENIQKYGWDEGRKKTAEENPANPYRNGNAVVQEDGSGWLNSWLENLKEWQENNRKVRAEEKEESKKFWEEKGKQIEEWFVDAVTPWFLKEKWSKIFDIIKISLTEKWESVKEWWDNNALSKWWKDSVTPWFSKQKWEEAMRGIKEAFESTWKGAVNVAIYVLNKFIDYINEKMHFEWDAVKVLGKELVPAGSVQLFTVPKIPYLATGAVIPPNAPFMAVLGDQRHGNNIETPEALLRKVVREESGNYGGGQYQFTAQINRRVLFDEFIEEAKLRQSTTGRNPLELA